MLSCVSWYDESCLGVVYLLERSPGFQSMKYWNADRLASSQGHSLATIGSLFPLHANYSAQSLPVHKYSYVSRLSLPKVALSSFENFFTSFISYLFGLSP